MATNQAHCSGCGSTDYEDLVADADEGYTGCCNKRTCHGSQFEGTDRFGTPTTFVRACCWGEAYAMFAAKGIEVPDGSCKF